MRGVILLRDLGRREKSDDDHQMEREASAERLTATMSGAIAQLRFSLTSGREYRRATETGPAGYRVLRVGGAM